MSVEAVEALDRLTQIALDNTSEDAHETVYEDAKRVRAEWQASCKVEAELEALLARWDDTERPDGWNSGDEHHLADLLITALRSASQPVQVEVTEASVKILAKHMANAASDWNHDDCDDDDHSLEHSNWEAYTGDALRALSAALTPLPAVPAPEVIPGTRAALDGLSIRTGGW